MIYRLLPRWLVIGLISMVTLASLNFAFKVAQATPRLATVNAVTQPDSAALIAHPTTMSPAPLKQGG